MTNIKEVLEKQRHILSQFEQELSEELKNLSENSLLQENTALSQELTDRRNELLALKEELSKLKEDYKNLESENKGLKNALHDQVYNERLQLLNASMRKMEFYFQNAGEQNRLKMLEDSVLRRINSMNEALKKEHVDLMDEIYTELQSFYRRVNERITQARQNASPRLTEAERSHYEALKKEPVTDEMLKGAVKKNNLESFIGLSLFNKLGILLILIGVIAGSRFTYVQLPDLLKGIFMFGLGGIMLAVGELLNRKKPSIFSLGIASGGVAVLFSSVSLSYFVLRILSMGPAVLICILITLVSFLLSMRYSSQTIASFALIGGYLPLLSVDTGIVYAAMVYFILLNLFAFSLALFKKWHIAAFIGLFLNIIETIFIIRQLQLSFQRAAGAFPLQAILAVLFVLFSFSIYTLIPVYGAFKQKRSLVKPDLVLLAINTVFSSLIMYLTFWIFNLSDFNGLLALIFALAYLLLGRFAETKLQAEKDARALFYLTGFAFVVLVVPLQFGVAWLTLGWLAEGLALTVYGVLEEKGNFRKAGLFVCGLCLASFLYFDALPFCLQFLLSRSLSYLFLASAFFTFKYTVMTLGSLFFMGAFIYKKQHWGNFERVFKYASVLNIWLYMLYLSLWKLPALLSLVSFDKYYLSIALMVLLTFLLAFLLPRSKTLADPVIRVMASGFYLIGLLVLFGLNNTRSPIQGGIVSASPSLLFMGSFLLILISILSVLSLYDLLQGWVRGGMQAELLPLFVAGYALLILTNNLILQYDLVFTSFILSILYVVSALLFAVFGFVRRYAYIRRFGLILSIMAVLKLFLVDLHSLSQGLKIVSYFALGITLLVISYVYQYFHKKLL